MLLMQKMVKNAISIMGKYDNEKGGLLQVGSIPIIESGNNENGSWTKWADGTMICRCTKQYSITTPNSIGTLYYGYRKLDDFPQTFIERPDITYSFF